MIRIVIADDERLIRDGLRAIIENEHDLEVVDEAADGAEAIARTHATHPDVVLMDIRMPGTDGLEATRHIVSNHPDVRVIVLTTFDLDPYVYEAVAAGASGFMVKDSRRVELIHAIRSVHAADTLLAPTVTRRLVEQYCRPNPDPAADNRLEQLTSREVDVLRLIAGGLSNGEIAAQLTIAETTVKTHVVRILAKLELRDRVQAVVAAYETGLVQRRA